MSGQRASSHMKR